jgi:hypothetical protein
MRVTTTRANSYNIKFEVTSRATSYIRAATTRVDLDYIIYIIIIIATNDIKIAVIGADSNTFIKQLHNC